MLFKNYHPQYWVQYYNKLLDILRNRKMIYDQEKENESI